MTEVVWFDKVVTYSEETESDDESVEEVTIESMIEEWTDFYELFLKPCLGNYSLFIKHQDMIRSEWASLKSKQIKLMNCSMVSPMASEWLKQYRRCADSLNLLKHQH